VTQVFFPKSTKEIDEDVAIAQQLCRALDIKHIVVDQSPSRLSAELRKNVLTEFCALEHAWGLPFTDRVTTGWDYVYDGIGGDVLSAGLFLTPKRLTLFEAGNFEALANEIMDRDGYLQKFLPAREYKRLNRDLAIQQLALELGRHAHAPNPVGSFYFYNRTRRTIAMASFNMLGRKAKPLTPYLDRELYDFLSSLPAHFFLDHQFHTHTILRAYPRYAHIPFEAKGRSSILDMKYFRRFAFETSVYALREPQGPLLRRSSLALRVFRSLVDRNYCREIMGFGPLALYLQQLGTFSRMNAGP